jgi:uncharacterized protein
MIFIINVYWRYDPMPNPCLETKCNQCCIETNMLLSKNDIKKIQNLGYDFKVFAKERQGWLQLQNTHGRCVFHDGNKCTIYENRPEGCTLYPVVYEKEGRQAFLDEACPQKHHFHLTKEKERQLKTLVSILENERKERLKK